MDNILIVMPRNLRDFLVAIPPAQDYQLQLVLAGQRKERDENFQFTFRMKEEYRYFEPILQIVRDKVPIFDYSGWEQLTRGEYDCYIDMDLSRAAEVNRANKLQMSQALGVLIGSGPFKWPIVKALQLKPPEVELDILVMNWEKTGDNAKRFTEKILEIHPEYTTIYDDRDFAEFEKDPGQIVEYINMFKIVIGPSSAATYLAATLKKGLIEVFENFDEMVYYNNAGIPYYQQVIGIPSMEVMWRLLEERWDAFHELLSDTSKRNRSIPMEQHPSTVEGVDGRF